MAWAGNVRDAVPVQVLGFCTFDARIPMLFPNDKCSADLCAAHDLTHLQPATIWNWNSGMLHLVKDNSALVHSPGRKIRPVQVLSKFPPGSISMVLRALSPFGFGSRSHTADIAVLSALQRGSSFGHPATLAQRHYSQTGAAWNLGWMHWPAHPTARRVVLTVLGESLLDGQMPKKGPVPPKLCFPALCPQMFDNVVFIHMWEWSIPSWIYILCIGLLNICPCMYLKAPSPLDWTF